MSIVECIHRDEEVEYPHLTEEGTRGTRTRAAFRVAQTGGYSERDRLSVHWTVFMKARRRRAIGRRLRRRDESLVLLRQQEKERLSKERHCSVEAELSNLAWARLSS